MSNVAVRITADVADLQAKFAVAQAESRAFTSELNKLARQAAEGNVGAELKGQLQQAAEAAAIARIKVKEIGDEFKKTGESPNSLRHMLLGLTDPIRGVYNSVGELAEAFAAAFAVERIVEFTNRVTDAAAHIYHEAEVLGLTTDAYQAFSQSARLAGVDQDVVDMAIRRFSAALGMAQEGVKAQAEAFLDMNVSTQQISQDALPQVARALLNMKDQAHAAYIETELFGRSGLEIRPALEQWAQGTDKLTAYLKSMGLVLDHDVTKKAEDAKIAMDTAWDQVDIAWTPAIVDLDKGLAWLATHWQDVISYARQFESILPGMQIGAIMDFMPKPPAMPHSAPEKPKAAPSFADTEASEVAALSGIDTKLREREDLTKQIALAQKALSDATKLGDTAGIDKANTALRDLKKQLDGIDHISKSGIKIPKPDASWMRDWQSQMRELDEESRSDAQRDIALARSAMEQKKQLLADEFANHQITAQQKYEDTVQALQAEAAAEAAAQQQIINSAVSSVVQKHEAANQIVEIDSQKDAAILAAQRQLTSDLKTEDEKRTADYRAMVSEMTNAEGQLVSNIFSKRQSLAADLLQIGSHLLQQEIANDLKAMTEHIAVNMKILAADKATAQEGLLYKLGVYLLEKTGFITAETAKTAAAVAANTTKAAATATAAASDTAAQVASATAQKAVLIGLAGAGGVASWAAAPWPINLGAPAFGAAMAADAAAYAVLDTGTNYVPRDMPAFIHAGERVLPKADNAAIIDAVRGGGSGGSNATHNWNYSPTIHAREPINFAHELERNGGVFLDFIRRSIRYGKLSIA